MSGFEMHPRELARYRAQSNRPFINTGWMCKWCLRRIAEITGRKLNPMGDGWICPACAAKVHEGK